MAQPASLCAWQTRLADVARAAHRQERYGCHHGRRRPQQGQGRQQQAKQRLVRENGLMHARAAQDAPLWVVRSALTDHSISARAAARSLSALAGLRDASSRLAREESCPVTRQIPYNLFTRSKRRQKLKPRNIFPTAFTTWQWWLLHLAEDPSPSEFSSKKSFFWKC